MKKPDSKTELKEMMEELGKNLVIAIANYGLAKLALAQEFRVDTDTQVTDADLRIGNNPTRALFTIGGPIPTANLELKHYLPKDRYVWSTMKAWWNGQIANAIANAGRCPQLKAAAILVQVGSNADLDNIGLKCAVDALVKNHVIPSDKKGVLQYLMVQHIETPRPEIRLFVFTPDEAFRNALDKVQEQTEFTESATPATPITGTSDSFFDFPQA